MTFDEIESCFPDGGTDHDGKITVSAQWLHDFAAAVSNLQKTGGNATFVVPDGWQLVPKKATPAMLKAGALARHSGACDGGYSIVGGPAADVCWPAMLDAAPAHNDRANLTARGG